MKSLSLRFGEFILSVRDSRDRLTGYGLSPILLDIVPGCWGFSLKFGAVYHVDLKKTNDSKYVAGTSCDWAYSLFMLTWSRMIDFSHDKPRDGDGFALDILSLGLFFMKKPLIYIFKEGVPDNGLNSK